MGALVQSQVFKAPSGAALAAVVQARVQAERASQAAIYTCLVVLASTLLGGNAHLTLSGAQDRSSQHLRDVALYLMHTCLGFSQAQLADIVGCARYSVGRAVSRIETAREDGVLNWKIEMLEALARDAVGVAA